MWYEFILISSYEEYGSFDLSYGLDWGPMVFQDKGFEILYEKEEVVNHIGDGSEGIFYYEALKQ